MSTNRPTPLARLRAAGYVPPGKGEGCRRCSHGTVFLDVDSKRVRCGKHLAVTACGGWCPSYSPIALVKAA